MKHNKINPCRAKIHRSYTVEEASNLFGVHKNTVRAWIKDGLLVCDNLRPTLILGSELRHYLKNKQQFRKRKCKPYEMYCLSCKAPKRPVDDQVELLTLGSLTGRLIGRCPSCNKQINRFCSTNKLSQFEHHWHIQVSMNLVDTL